MYLKPFGSPAERQFMYRKTIKPLLLALAICTALPALAKFSLPPSLSLSGDNGAYFIPKKKPFEMGAYLKKYPGRVFAVYYVDPDERAKSEPLESLLKKIDYPATKLQHLVMINLKAATLPGWLLRSIMYKRAKNEVGRSTYVMDRKKVLTKPPYSLPDNAYFFALLNKKHEVIYSHTGQMSNEEAQKIMGILAKEIAK